MRSRFRIHTTDETGQPTTPGRAFRRSAAVRRGWFNWQQLMRQLAIMEFLSRGADEIRLWDDSAVGLALSRHPVTYGIEWSIDEAEMALAGEDPEIMHADADGEPFAEEPVEGTTG